MIFREAEIEDIIEMQVVRNSVKENVLSNPAFITDKDYEEHIRLHGKGWVCQINNSVVGFAIADLQKNNIWALFLHPGYEKNGIGKKLHEMMLEWYFSKTNKKIWLGTAPNTRAEMFYRKRGWKEVGKYGKDEIKFEMTYDDWIENKKG